MEFEKDYKWRMHGYFMKKGLIGMFVFGLILVSFGLVSAAPCDQNDIILKLYSATNSHAATWNSGSTYSTGNICYSQFFGGEYSGIAHPVCTSENSFLYLYQDANSHVSVGSSTGYTKGVCYGNLNCAIKSPSCGPGEVAIASLYSQYNSHIAKGNVAGYNYNYKLCCGVGAKESVAEWRNLKEENIEFSTIGVGAQVNDYVKMVVTNPGVADDTEVSFEIFEDDGLLDEDPIRTVTGSVVGGVAVGYWKITLEDLSKTDDYNNFKFRVRALSKESGELRIGEEDDDAPFNVTILSPECGEDFSLGTTIDIVIVAEDEDDIISGNVSLEAAGFPKSFGNEGYKGTVTLNNEGNSQVVVYAENSRGRIARKISSIMVIGPSENKDYVAACIDEPSDFSDIPSGEVKFLAAKSRGIRVVAGVRQVIIPLNNLLDFDWTFIDGKGIISKYRGEEELAYKFYKMFVNGGRARADLIVKISISA